MNVLLKACKIMKSDARLLSYNEGTYFWNEPFSGVGSGQERQDFNRFSELESIDPSLVKGCGGDTSLEDMERLFKDHEVMSQGLRGALLIDPDKNAHEKMMMATRCSFMLIMFKACDIYRHGL